MKQHITIKQLNELNEEGQKKLGDWLIKKGKASYRFDLDDSKLFKYFDKLRMDCFGECGYPECYGLPLLSIGQMIEFLDEYKKWLSVHNLPKADRVCDTLWEPVKEILNGNEKTN